MNQDDIDYLRQLWDPYKTFRHHFADHPAVNKILESFPLCLSVIEELQQENEELKEALKVMEGK